VNGQRMFLDEHDSLGFLTGDDYEPLATSVVKRCVRVGASVVDVGAHIGYYTLLFARLVGPTGRVVAFEPDPENFGLLERNVALNRYANVVSRQAAVADISGRLAFDVGGAAWGHHLRAGADKGSDQHGQAVEVEVVRLDDVVPTDMPVDFLKIDVEGVEMLALGGMPELLRRSPNVQILTEFWPTGLRRAGTDPADYLRALLAHGFTLHDIDEVAGELRSSTVAELVARYPSGGSIHTNLLCSRIAVNGVSPARPD